jgi:hypothetical protein
MTDTWISVDYKITKKSPLRQQTHELVLIPTYCKFTSEHRVMLAGGGQLHPIKLIWALKSPLRQQTHEAVLIFI